MLSVYLHPDLSEEEKKEAQERRSIKRQESMRSFRESVEDMQFESKPDQVRVSVKAANLQGYNEGSSNDIESEESDFLAQFKKPVRFEDMDLKYKGAHNLKFVGKI